MKNSNTHLPGFSVYERRDKLGFDHVYYSPYCLPTFKCCIMLERKNKNHMFMFITIILQRQGIKLLPIFTK